MNLSPASYLLAGSTLEGAVAFVALVTVLFSRCGALAVTDEVESYFHLFCEAQQFDFNDLLFDVWRTLLRLDGNLKVHLGSRGEFISVIKPHLEDASKLIVTFYRRDSCGGFLFLNFSIFFSHLQIDNSSYLKITATSFCVLLLMKTFL